MAAGDILSVAVDASGEFAAITIEGRATGGTYSMGLGSGALNRVNDLSQLPRITLTVTSKGFAQDGSATTLTRLVYGQTRGRKVTPNQGDANETTSGSDVIVRVWLSEPIYAKDKSGAGNSGTDVTYSIASGFYTVSGNGNNAGSGTATNNSTAAYPTPTANWSRVPFEITGSTHRIGVSPWQHAGRGGAAFACVEFTATDEHSNSVTARVTTTSVVNDMSDPTPVVEAIWDMSTTSFTNGDKITVNAVVKGFLGDTTADSSAGPAAPSPLFGPFELQCDRTGALRKFHVRVSNSGNDAGANTVYEGTYDESTMTYKFATIAAALKAVRDRNNSLYGQDDAGVCVVHLDAGNYAWLGSSPTTLGNTPKCWITIQPADGVARSAVVINSKSGISNFESRIKVKNCTITVATANTFQGITALCFEDCEFNTSGTAIITVNTRVVYLLRCLLTQLAQGLRPAGNTNCVFGLVRGCDYSTLAKTTLVYTVIGNIRTTTGVCDNLFTDAVVTSGELYPVTTPILAFNKMMGLNCPAAPALLMGANVAKNGGVIAQNLFEAITGFSSGMFDLCASEGVTTNTPCNYWRVYNNIIVGLKTQIGYNSSGSTQKDRRYWDVFGNVFTDWNIKIDCFPVADAARIGASGLANGVGISCNVNLESVGENGSEQVGAGGSFALEFEGINSYQPTKSAMVSGSSQAQSSNTSVQNYAEFITYAAFRGQTSGTGAGNGNYHFNEKATSPLLAIKSGRRVLSHDLEGRTRADNDPPGCYTWQHPGQMMAA